MSHKLFLPNTDRFVFTPIPDSATVEVAHYTLTQSGRSMRSTVESVENARVLYKALKAEGATTECPHHAVDDGRCLDCGHICY